MSRRASSEPGPDELRVRGILRQRGVGPAALPPKPVKRPPDWLDDILNSPPSAAAEAPPPAPEPAPVPAAAEKPKPKTAKKPRTAKPKQKKGKKAGRRRPGQARTAWDSRPPSPRQSLAEAYDRIPYRLKWLAYHASAAYLGWTAGLVSWVTYVTAWIAATGLGTMQAALWYGTAAAAFLLYRQTRRRWFPVAWLAAVPASSVVVGVLLYGTPSP
ncbi:hypothetical protein AB0F46_18650 [Streptomyces sp. NPDC026665]|uniref:hypothetical protein n=1 Tax=Streptomyces sp. NPDC026665 TaxID=3154798 RepID=UPI0034025579